MVNYISLYKKFVEHHVIKLILLKISKLSARLTQAIVRDKLQRLKHTQDICTRQLITMFKCARALDKSNLYLYLLSFVDTPRKFIISIRHFMYKKGRVNSNSRIISTDEDPSLRIESSAIINLCGVSTKLNKYIVFTMQTYKKLIATYIVAKNVIA